MSSTFASSWSRLCASAGLIPGTAAIASEAICVNVLAMSTLSRMWLVIVSTNLGPVGYVVNYGSQGYERPATPHGASPSVSTPARIVTAPAIRHRPYPSPSSITPSNAPSTIPTSRVGAT